MWLVELVSWLVGPTVGGLVDAVISCVFGIFILLWNISPVALVIFIAVLIGLSKISGKVSAIFLEVGAIYASFHFGHPVIAGIFVFFLLKTLFTRNSADETWKKIGATDAETIQKEVENVNGDEPVRIYAPENGIILQVGVSPGVMVNQGSLLMKIKTENGITDVTSPKDGIVFNVFVFVGKTVNKGDALLQV